MRVGRKKTLNTGIRITGPGSAVLSAQKSQGVTNLSLFQLKGGPKKKEEEKKAG